MLKKTVLTLFFVLIASLSASAKEVYITSINAPVSMVDVYLLDETIRYKDPTCSLKIKYIYPDGKWKRSQLTFEKTKKGWKAWEGSSGYGYMRGWPNYVRDVFEWIRVEIHL